MLSSAIIIFREVLEAALLVGILAAATRSVAGRSLWIAAGVATGLAGAALLAGFTDVIANLASGVGQELLNAGILLLAVFMLAWHNIWMSSHGKAMADSARNIGNSIREGRSELSALFLVVSAAVLREGAETVLFMYGVSISDGSNSQDMLLGSLLGLLAGLLTGYVLYRGLMRIPLHTLFKTTGLLILLMAGGMASQAAGMLTQANLITFMSTPLWDSSNLLSPSSAAGVVLHALTGYEAQPTGMQVIIYVLTILFIAAGMYLVSRPDKQTVPASKFD